MRFDQGARVLSMDGRPIGSLYRVVIDPKTKRITHIVIRSGILIKQDKVVPLDLVDMDEQNRLLLRLNARHLAGMPDFGVAHYRVVSEDQLPRDGQCSSPLPAPACWCPPYPAAAVRPALAQLQIKGIRLNIPAGTVALKVGARVISADDKHLGHADRVLASPPSGRVGYLQVSKGRGSQARKLVPIEWTDQLEEDQVFLTVGARIIQDLPE